MVAGPAPARPARVRAGTSRMPWAAQTQRSMQNFDIARDTDRMPIPIVRAFGILKKCAAKVNIKYGLDKKICNYAITQPMRL